MKLLVVSGVSAVKLFAEKRLHSGTATKKTSNLASFAAQNNNSVNDKTKFARWFPTNCCANVFESPNGNAPAPPMGTPKTVDAWMVGVGVSTGRRNFGCISLIV